MKKRLLITSIVMMLVVAVALSTATYAWFTSNATVKASSISMTAATNNAPSIGITWDNAAAYGTEIVAAGPAGGATFAPMVPSVPEETEFTTTTTITAATAAGGVDFYSATIKDDPAKFNNDVKTWTAGTVAPYVWTDGTGTGLNHTSFFLKNLSDTYGLGTVKLSATLEGAGADLIRIAVFARKSTTANQVPTGSFTLQKILSNVVTYTKATSYTDDTTYYTAAKDGTIAQVGSGQSAHAIASATDFTTYTTKDTETTDDDVEVYTRSAVAAASTAYAVSGFAANDTVGSKISSNTTDNAVEVDLGALDANCIVELIVYVWTDGAALVDNRGGQTASIKLDVAATRAA